MGTRTQTISIYRKESAHPKALGCAAFEDLSTALLGVLDECFCTSWDGFPITQGPAMTFGCFGVTRSGRFSALHRKSVLTLTPGRSAVLERVALRAAPTRRGRGVIHQQAVLSS
jgi:hypothetical protein